MSQISQNHDFMCKGDILWFQWTTFVVSISDEMGSIFENLISSKLASTIQGPFSMQSSYFQWETLKKSFRF